MPSRVVHLPIVLLVACRPSPTPPSVPPPRVDLPSHQFAWLSVTARSVGQGLEWTALPLVCTLWDGQLALGVDCLDALPVGAPVVTFQGRHARIAGRADHPCSFERRAVPGWHLWVDPAAPSESPRPFSLAGSSASWLPRAARPSTEQEQAYLPPADGEAVTRTALSYDLLPDPGPEALVERHQAGAGSQLWIVGETGTHPLPWGAAPPDSLREVAGLQPLGADRVLALVWSHSPSGGAGKHVLQFRPETGDVELLTEWWCGAPPPSTRPGDPLKR